jgi:hypothetical protein
MGMRTWDREETRGWTRKGHDPESSLDFFSGVTSVVQLTQTLSTVRPVRELVTIRNVSSARYTRSVHSPLVFFSFRRISGAKTSKTHLSVS